MSQGEEAEVFVLDPKMDPVEGFELMTSKMEEWVDGELQKKKISVAGGGVFKKLLAGLVVCGRRMIDEVKLCREMRKEQEQAVKLAVSQTMREVKGEMTKERGVLIGAVVEHQEKRMREVNDEMKGCLAAWRDESDRIGQSLRDLMSGVEEGSRIGKGVPRLTGVNEEIGPMGVRVIITADGKSVDEVKENLKRMIQPEELGVGVKAVVKTKRGLVVEVDSEEGREKLVARGVENGLTMKKEKGEMPMVVVRGVPKEMTNDELMEKVRKGNFMELSKEDFGERFVVVHRLRRRGEERGNGGAVNVLVKCRSEMRNKMVRSGRVFVGWESLVVTDHIDVPRCFNCQGYGHVSKLCSKEARCGRCGKEHVSEACTMEKGEKRVCANCVREGFEANHDVGWWGCPMYRKAIGRYTSRVDYGV